MTWIRVIPFDEDETLRHARAAQQKLYPIEYAEPTHPQYKITKGLSGRTRCPRRDVSHVCGIRGADVSRPAPDADAASARNDHDGGVGCQPLQILTGVARRVSA
jgi:hypothetical protein